MPVILRVIVKKLHLICTGKGNHDTGSLVTTTY